MAEGTAKPLHTGTTCVTPSPLSSTSPLVSPLAYSDRMACIDTKKAGTLKVSKKISAARSRLRRGLSGASVSNTGCCSLCTASCL